MPIEQWLTFVLASVLISIAPGSGMVNTLSNGMVYGLRHSLPSILGLQLGLAAQFLIVGIGLGALLASSEAAFTLVKWLGVGYLAWLGVMRWRQPSIPLNQYREGKNLEYGRRFRQSALINLTNPKATVFLVALLPQFIDPSRPQLPQIGLLAATGIGVDLTVMCGYAWLAQQAARWLQSERHQRQINRITGSLFLLAAGLMAGYRR
ncbi:MAG TPA: homoserine/homoserine lactone efflux protein [Gammaproteobacteria bacterium]|nr:homoserine/homoserine lactone efflux protein [Gammaproteobacteria bacterium]